MATENLVLSRSSLLNRYYDERALSSLPNGNDAYFQFGEVVWGYDLITYVDSKPTCEEIPLDMATVANVFHQSEANYAYINGNIVITAILPAGIIPSGDSKEFSCIGVLDGKGQLVAVAVSQPVWIYTERGLTIEIVISTPRSDSATLAVGGA